MGWTGWRNILYARSTHLQTWKRKSCWIWQAVLKTTKWVSWEMDALAKWGTMIDLPKTMSNIQDVNHTLQRHSTTNKQRMLNFLMFFLSPPIFFSPFKHRILDHMGFDSGLMRNLLRFLNSVSPPERIWKHVCFMGQMDFFLGFYQLPVSVRVGKSCVKSSFWWKELTAVQEREAFFYLLHRAGYAELMP